MVSVQEDAVPAAAQAPPQPRKVSPARATEVSVTLEPVMKLALAVVQPGPQLMATGAEVTVPCPVAPATLSTVSVASVPTASTSVSELLVETLSTRPAGAATVAVLASELVPVPDTTAPVTVKVATPPATRFTPCEMLPVPLAVTQEEPAVAEQVQVGFAASGAWKVSVTSALVTSLGPWLVTVSV